MQVLAAKSFAAAGDTGWIPVKMGPMYPNKFAVQVKGTGAAASAWSAVLEGSLDGVNPTTLLTHSSGDGTTIWPADAIPRPVAYVRGKLNSVTLGSATAVVVTILATA